MKDSEFEDRFWIRIRGATSFAEVTFVNEDAVALNKALQDLVAEITR